MIDSSVIDPLKVGDAVRHKGTGQTAWIKSIMTDQWGIWYIDTLWNSGGVNDFTLLVSRSQIKDI